MPMWHCPHCGTPQPEASRCWVCRRSSTCCATCANFRHAVAGGLGFCGLDRRRELLRGDEIRPCWEAATDTPGGDPNEHTTVAIVAVTQPAFGLLFDPDR